MRSVSITEARQRFAALLEAAQRDPILIRRRQRDVAVIVSARAYDRLRALYLAELERLCNRVGERAAARGFTPEKLAAIMEDHS